MTDLKKVVSEKYYTRTAQPGWPTYTDYIAGNIGADVLPAVSEFTTTCTDQYQQLIQQGAESGQINQRSQQQIFFDKQFTGNRHCRVPWETMSVGSSGEVYICVSPSWVPRSVGNVLSADCIYKDVLNSPMAQAIRQEILQGRYYYCNTLLCRFFNHFDPSEYQLTANATDQPLPFEPNALAQVTKIPAEIIFDFDPTCNLQCPSCRLEVINYNKHTAMRAKNDNISEKIKHLIIDNIDESGPVTIRWAGGEPFISEVYLDLMEYIINTGHHNIRHVIQTNGSYLQKKSDLITRLLPFIKELRISFDAATEETYRRTRVNGQWDLLLSNVRWIMAQIQQNNLQTRVSADYVVQLDNYDEIPAFRELCNELGIKHINYQRMWNWHTWSEDELQRRNVYNINHPLYFTVIKKLADVNDFDGQRLYQQLPPESK